LAINLQWQRYSATPNVEAADNSAYITTNVFSHQKIEANSIYIKNVSPKFQITPLFMLINQQMPPAE
jgi:hypothetical protein